MRAETLPPIDDYEAVVGKVRAFVEEHMAGYGDPSHNMQHVERVTSTALAIAGASNCFSPNVHLVELAALLHDVGDFKFAREGDATAATTIADLLGRLGVPPAWCAAVVWINERISYRHELANPADFVGPHFRELFCVQDADRLDAIGAIGIARCFSYGATRNAPLYEEACEPAISMTGKEYDEATRANKTNARNHFYGTSAPAGMH